MASHVELNPDDNVLGLSLGMKAMRLALTQKTHKVGTVRIPTGGNTDVIIGDGAQDGANRIDRDGNQLPLVDTSGIDKAAQDARKAADDAAAKADEAIKQGEQIRQDAQAGIDDARKQAQDAADKADKARSDLQAEMDANKQAADNAIANVDKKADKAQSDLEAQTAALKSSIANVDAKAEQVKADASKISQRVDADKAALDKSIASVDAKAQAASDKGDQLAGQISDVTTTVNGHTTKLGELSTRIEGVASDGQTTVKSLTSLQQTVTGLSSTVSQNTKTASDAMSKVSQVEQTANGISANLSKNYTTTADADEKYAAKTELKATADGLQANITRSQQTADGAVTAASKAQATADGFGATLSKDYQTTAASDEKYSTKADLKATSDSISSSLSSVKQTADGAVTAASKAQQTADAVTLNLSKNYQTKAQNDAVYATKTSLKVTSDSLSASISSTAKTAQSAVDKATNLEANLNGFKTTVSQTYTTKTDFDSLQIGGTNLCPKSNPYNISLSNASKDSSGVITGTVPTNANATWGASVTPGYATHLKTPYGRQCVISFDVWSEIAATVVVDINNMPESVAAWNGNDNDGWRGGVQPTTTNGAFACSIPAKQWIRLWVTYSNTSAKNTGKVDIFDQSHIGLRPASAAYQVKFKDFKFELGSRPTEYSPCPSDLQSAGDYATKSELSQTADGIKAQVSEASKTASGAMSKATTLEQTANSLSSTITAQGKTLEATTKTANTAKATADSNTTAISQVKSTADGTVTRISNLEQNLDGFKTTVAKTYQDKAGMSNYATNSALKQTSDTITSQVSEVSKTASGAMSKVTSLEQTANGLSTKITEQGKTLDATVKTANEAKSTADSNKTAISQVSTTANNALSKTSSLEQNLSGFKTSVANTYTTKADFNNLTIGGTNLLLNTSGVFVGHPSTSGVNANAGWLPRLVDGLTYSTLSAGTYQLRFEVMTDTEVGSYTVQWADTPWDISSFSLSKGVWKTLTYTIVKPDGATGKARGFMLRTDNVPTSATIRVRRAKLERGSRPTDWSPAPQDSQAAGDYATNSSLTQTANQIRGEVSEKYQSKNGMSSYATTSALTQKADEITGKVAEVAKTASGAMGKASSVEQTASALSSKLSETVRTLDSTVQTVNTVKSTADSNRATLTQVAKTASDASSRASSVEQNLNGFKTTVSQTYGRGSNLWVNPTFDPDKPQITSLVDNVTAPNGSGVNLLASRDHYNGATSFPVVPGHTYVITAHAKKIKGDISLIAGIWYTAQTSGNAWDSIVHAESTSNLSDGWMAATWRFTCPNSKSRGCVYFQIDQWHNSLTTQWYVANVVCVDVTGLQPAGDYATKSYVNQNAKTIALGVVENYKGSDGSGLATKSDITASNKSITSTVASTYATKSGVTQEISSKITQNNNSLDVKFATKNETKTAQATANAAKSDASDAQSRVGTLEDCISLTSAGVRAGHQKNGVFNGVSALVNTDGSFDLLDASGNLLTRINQHRFQVTGDDGTGGGYLSLSQDGINITVQPTADTSKTYHIQVGKSGVGITAPDGSSIQCSTSGGLNIETVKYGKISIGAGGLQFTNDQGWGLRLSAAGWSLKWAGNHTLATGPAAGKLYIDGREIVTK
jgi:uncharacterized coiled-coil DUF342 family protein